MQTLHWRFFHWSVSYRGKTKVKAWAAAYRCQQSTLFQILLLWCHLVDNDGTTTILAYYCIIEQTRVTWLCYYCFFFVLILWTVELFAVKVYGGIKIQVLESKPHKVSCCTCFDRIRLLSGLAKISEVAMQILTFWKVRHIPLVTVLGLVTKSHVRFNTLMSFQRSFSVLSFK